MPENEPGSAVSVWPSTGLPVTAGGVVLTGALGATVAVAGEVLVSSPAALVAVTMMRTVPVTSSAVSV